MKVLIADDNEDARAILKRTLAHDGHETETARNGVEALEKTRADPPDLIISDILMPEMDGFKLCGEIKSSPALKQIPFVFYTATYLDEKDAQLALDLGASRYIAKPLAPDAFLEMIQEVMAECKAGVLPVPDKPKEKTSVLFGMYEESVSAKLEKKVAELSLYQNIFFHSKNAVAILDRDGFYMEQNPAHRALTGYSDAELRGKTPAVHLGEAVFANILNQLSEKGVYRGELLGRTKSGKKTEIELFSFPIRDHKGRVSCYVGIERDLTEQNRAKRLESEQRRVLELITRGETSLTGIFERITEVAEVYCPDVRGSILILEGGIVRHGAAPSMPSAYNALLEGLEVGPKAGSCGTAMYRKARVVVSDIRTDPLWEGYRDLGEEYGFRACWSQPILGVDQNVLGAFALYREQPGGPDADEIRLIESMSHLAGLAIERKQAETKIRTLSQTVEQSPVSVIITDTDGNIEYVNSTFEKVSGYTAEEVIGRNPRLLKSGGTPKNRYQALWRAITRGKSWEGELLNRKKNGEAFWESVHIAPVLDESGVIQHYLAVKEDITLRKKQEERLLHQAHFDSLTDLPNRFLSLDRLSQLLKEAERVDCQVAVMFVDLDDFKKVNDTLGHEAGDTLLLEAAERLRTVVRNGDTVGRLGGDEFIVLLGGLSDAADTRPVATGILERFKRPFNINGRKIRLSATVGIAVYPEDGGTPSEMLRCA
ncbi:MAG: diguanylate cyclase domain-containing protein, partial [Nitrospiria bacterium]